MYCNNVKNVKITNVSLQKIHFVKMEILTSITFFR
jgi:hypothetical protein